MDNNNNNASRDRTPFTVFRSVNALSKESKLRKKEHQIKNILHISMDQIKAVGHADTRELVEADQLHNKKKVHNGVRSLRI